MEKKTEMEMEEMESKTYPSASYSGHLGQEEKNLFRPQIENQ